MNKPNRTTNSVSIITVSEERGLNLNNQPSMSEQKKNSSDFPQDNEWEQVAIVFCEKFDNGHALENLDKKQKQPVTSGMKNSSIPDSNMKQKQPVTSAMKKPSIPEDSNKKQPVTSAMKQMTTAEDLQVDSNKSKTISEDALIEEMEYAFEQELYDSAGVGPELNQKK